MAVETVLLPNHSTLFCLEKPEENEVQSICFPLPSSLPHKQKQVQEKLSHTHHFHLRASTTESCTFCFITVTCLATLHTDLSCMALAFLIVLALSRLTVDLACRTRLTGHIAVGTAFSFFKAVTACLCSFPCRFSSHRNCVQITIKIFVVHTCLYCTF